MSRKMLINASDPEEIRVALVEGSILEEYYVERMSVESCLGNIYKGRVTNVEPSIGAAFVEFGGPRHGFLHVSDIMEATLPTAASRAKAASKRKAEDASAPDDADVAEDEALDAEALDADSADTDSVDDASLADDSVEDDSVDDASLAGDSVEDDSVEDDSVEDDSVDDASLADDSVEDESEEGEVEDAELAEPDVDASDESVESADEPDAEAADDEVAADAEVDEEAAAEVIETAPRTTRRRSRRSKKKAPKEPETDAETSDAATNGKTVRKKNRSILDYVKKGDEIIVQVTKDGIGTKGPTLTTYLSIPGRYLVLMPGHDRRGVSRKIDDGKERDRLKGVLDQLEVEDGLGFIVRTAGIGQTKRSLQKDYSYLAQMWEGIEKEASSNKAPRLLYQESDLVSRTIRDIYRPDMGDVIVDEEDVARRAREFLGGVMPRAAKNVKLYTGERPLFTAYGIEDEIGQLFLHRVELKSGGSLIIEQTEALVAIDVNSGRFREEEDLEETAYKINVEAADAIARQLRLRDLGGVIVLDFIDMRSEKRRRAVEKAFRESLRSDRARTKVARMSMFGTIEMTRQRVRPSLRQSIFKRCPACRGVGFVATPETLQLNLIRQMKLMLARKNKGLEVFVNNGNAEYLVNDKRDRILALESSTQKRIQVRIEPELRDDEFRIMPLEK